MSRLFPHMLGTTHLLEAHSRGFNSRKKGLTGLNPYSVSEYATFDEILRGPLLALPTQEVEMELDRARDNFDYFLESVKAFASSFSQIDLKTYQDIKSLGLYMLFETYHEDNTYAPFGNTCQFVDFWDLKLSASSFKHFKLSLGNYISSFKPKLWEKTHNYTEELAFFILDSFQQKCEDEANEN